MAVSASYRILFFCACICFASADHTQEASNLTNRSKPRSLIIISDPDSVLINPITENTLKSGLTNVFLPIIYIIVFVIGLPSNAMAVWVLLFRSKKIHPSAIYMGNLALADLMFVIWTPLKIAYHLKGNNWTYGEGMCKVMVGFFYGNMYCSILFIACLSVQRYWVCAHPLSEQRKDNKLAIIVSVCIWIFIGVSTTPLYLYQQTVELQDLNITTCHDVHNISKKNFEDSNMFEDIKEPYYYFMVMAGLVFFIPMVIIIVAYVLLLRSLGGSAMKKTRQRAIILIVTVLVTFLVCFIPSNVMLVMHYSFLSKGWENNGYGFYLTTLSLTSLNSCLDPFIYYYVSDDFRDQVKNTLLCRSNRTVDSMRAQFSSMKYSQRTKTYTSTTGNTETSTC